MFRVIKKINTSASYCIVGIKDTFKEEFMARVQFSFGLIQFILGLLFHFSFFMMIVISILWLLLVSAELMNTAVENVCDFVASDKQQYIKRAKDSAGAAVFIISVFNWVMFVIFLGVSLYA